MMLPMRFTSLPESRFNEVSTYGRMDGRTDEQTSARADGTD
jgi:hypothetical protein